MKQDEFLHNVNNLQIGKQLPAAIYMHTSLLSETRGLGALIERVADALKLSDWNVVKLHRNEFRVSFLTYPDFDTDPYPSLQSSVVVDLHGKTTESRTYTGQANPPILHRKELLVPDNHPLKEEFDLITKEGESAGLYDNPSAIGHKQSWEFFIRQKGYELVDGRLFRSSVFDTQVVNRERTAISRFQLSAPFQTIGRLGYLDGQYTILDYGCGRGDDMSILEESGLDVIGWDPNFRPGGMCAKRDIVNLGYVINVIEDRNEREEALAKAYGFTNILLIVSAMIASDKQIERFRPFKDGVLTSRNTFQKYYSQQTLKEYITETLKASAIPLATGIFGIFRDADLEFQYLEKRYRRNRDWSNVRRIRPTRQQRLDAIFKTNRDKFDNYWITSLSLGRLAKETECDELEALKDLAGTRKNVHQLIIQNYNQEDLKESERQHREDLILAQAMSFFSGRRLFKDIPLLQKNRIRHFFGNYSELKGTSQVLLEELVNTELLYQDALDFQSSEKPCWFEGEKSITVHKKFVDELPLRLRTYVECATQLFGDLESIQLVKLHLHTGKVSFLGYEGFDSSPIPMLIERVKVSLWNQWVKYYDYIDEFKPKPLYHKSIFIDSSFDDYKKQVSFDQKLVKFCLMPENPSFGPSRQELDLLLREKSLEIKGYRFYLAKEAP